MKLKDDEYVSFQKKITKTQYPILGVRLPALRKFSKTVDSKDQELFLNELPHTYYDEYMPYERLEQDVKMMKKAGINVVRIAESTWSTCEPQEGVFDFSHVERVLDAMEAAGIQVIIGPPTYAIPSWMEKSSPDILAETKKGRGIYGPR